MVDIPVEDFVFGLCAIVGGVLLLITIVFDDVLGGVLDAFGVDIGGTSLTPILLGFVAMFGVGGLFATQVLDLHGGAAAVVAAIGGAGGAAIAAGLFQLLQRSESAQPFSLRDLIGQTARVAIAIPAGRSGSVYVHAEGQTHEISATAGSDIPGGALVRIIDVAGNGVVVEASASASGSPEGG